MLNAFNLSFVEFDEKKIIHINRDNDVFVDEHIEIDIKKWNNVFWERLRECYVTLKIITSIYKKL